MKNTSRLLAVKNFSEYAALLKQQDAYWRIHSKRWPYPFSVLDDENSYISTIQDGHAITCRETWDDLSKDETTTLLGLGKGGPGLLGGCVYGDEENASISG